MIENCARGFVIGPRARSCGAGPGAPEGKISGLFGRRLSKEEQRAAARGGRAARRVHSLCGKCGRVVHRAVDNPGAADCAAGGARGREFTDKLRQHKPHRPGLRLTAARQMIKHASRCASASPHRAGGAQRCVHMRGTSQIMPVEKLGYAARKAAYMLGKSAVYSEFMA